MHATSMLYYQIMSSEHFSCDTLCDPQHGHCFLRSSLEAAQSTIDQALQPTTSQEEKEQLAQQVRTYLNPELCRIISLATALSEVED